MLEEIIWFLLTVRRPCMTCPHPLPTLTSSHSLPLLTLLQPQRNPCWPSLTQCCSVLPQGLCTCHSGKSLPDPSHHHYPLLHIPKASSSLGLSSDGVFLETFHDKSHHPVSTRPHHDVLSHLYMNLLPCGLTASPCWAVSFMGTAMCLLCYLLCLQHPASGSGMYKPLREHLMDGWVDR